MAVRRGWVPDRQEVTWIDCSPQVGSPMQDVHPMLVLSPRSFEECCAPVNQIIAIA